MTPSRKPSGQQAAVSARLRQAAAKFARASATESPPDGAAGIANQASAAGWPPPWQAPLAKVPAAAIRRA